MPKITWYATKKLFTGEPKTLSNLRDNQQTKLNAFKDTGQGTFAFTMQAPDNQPILVISWKGDAEKKSYWDELVKKGFGGLKFIKGTYTADKKAKTYSFSIDKADKAMVAQLKEYMKDATAVSIAFWNLIGPDVNIITLDGVGLTKRRLNDATWDMVEWDLSRTLTNGGPNFLFKTAPLGATTEVTDKDGKWHQMSNGLLISADMKVKVTVSGKIAERAADNPHSAAFFRDEIAKTFKKRVDELATDLKTINSEIPAAKDKAARAKLEKKANAALDEFFVDIEKELVASASEQWLTLLEAKIEYRDYQVETAVNITRGVVTFAVGVTVAGVGGISGVGAILGFIGTLKGGLETAETIYMAFRDVEALEDSLRKSLLRRLRDNNMAGWKDMGASFFSALPGGSALSRVVESNKFPIRPLKGLKKDFEVYKGKVPGLLVEATNLGKKVAKTIEKSTEAISALETQEVRDAEAADPALKLRNKAAREKIALATTQFLDKIGDQTKGFKKGKENIAEFTKLFAQVEAEINRDVLATVLRDVVTPLFSLPWGIKPENLAVTIIETSGTAVQMLEPLVTELRKHAKQNEEAAEWLKTATEWTAGIMEILEKVKEASEAATGEG